MAVVKSFDVLDSAAQQQSRIQRHFAVDIKCWVIGFVVLSDMDMGIKSCSIAFGIRFWGVRFGGLETGGICLGDQTQQHRTYL